MKRTFFLSLLAGTLLALVGLVSGIPRQQVHAVALSSGMWSLTGGMVDPRGFHTATLLANGKVLVVGGSSIGTYLATAELYDPATGMWSATGSMTAFRSYHTATLLDNGKVLVTGGYDASVELSAELYDPATDMWSATGSMTTPRSAHTATLLGNGKVLVTGGYDASAELYDPATGMWSLTGSMATPRSYHTAMLLANGKVLVAGGYSAGSGTSLVSAELYDPVTGTWSTTGSMTIPRAYHAAALLSSGKVLVTGGYNAGNGNLASVELYDPATGTWSTTGSMATPRINHTETLLTNGQVLVAGGGHYNNTFASAELYDPSSETWSSAGDMNSTRYGHTATLLANGEVLVTGGNNGGGRYGYTRSAELFSLPDATLPALHVPTTIIVNSTSLQGAVVSYIVTASDSDNDTSQLTITCTPPSGSTFASKTTTVQCTAGDPAGNTASGHFQVIVNGESHQIGDLIQVLHQIQQGHPLPHSLELALERARNKLNRGNETPSCQQLASFIHLVHAVTPKSLTQDQANQLIRAATNIQSVLSCQ